MFGRKHIHTARVSAVVGALAVLGLTISSGSAQAGASPIHQAKPQADGIIAVLIGVVERDLDPPGTRAATAAGAPSAINGSQLTAPLGSTKGSFVNRAAAGGHLLPYVEQDN